MWGGDRFRPHSRPPPIIAHWILSISHPLVYDSDDELLSAGNSTYAYDADGNRNSETVNGVTTAFGYDYDNQLISITTGSKCGRLAWKARQPNGGRCDHLLLLRQRQGYSLRSRAELSYEHSLGVPMHLNTPADKWIPGKTYAFCPTYATCNISVTRDQPVNHDVSTRLIWTLRPMVSIKQKDWQKKRAAMTDACTSCHGTEFVKDFYTQFNSVVNLYNNKFAISAMTIMDKLTAEEMLTTQPFDATIKWTSYELWHHEGRRARMGHP